MEARKVERLVTHLGVGILRADAAWIVQGVGDRALQLLGLPLSSVRRRSLVSVLSTACHVDEEEVRRCMSAHQSQVWRTRCARNLPLRATVSVGDGGVYVVLDELPRPLSPLSAGSGDFWLLSSALQSLAAGDRERTCHFLRLALQRLEVSGAPPSDSGSESDPSSV